MRSLNPRTLQTPRSGIREIVNRVVGQDGVLRLEIGQPSFAPPQHVIDAVSEGAEKSGGYSASAGTTLLRELVQKKLASVNGIQAPLENITITVGAMGAITAAIMTTCREGDRILIPDIAWPNFEMVACALGLEVGRYRCGADTGFTPDFDSIEAAITPNTSLLVVNSPSNPAGVVFSPGTMRQLLEVAERHNLWLLSDETYDQLVLNGLHYSPATDDSDGRVISVFSFSKTYAMPGWRVGYVVAAEPVSEQIQKLQEPLVSCAPTISQVGAVAALTGPQEFVDMSVREYRGRRDDLMAIVPQRAVPVSPTGAFYMMVDISHTGMTSRDFALSLLRAEGVAVAPGSAFGAADSFIRLCFAVPSSVLVEGAQRLLSYASRQEAAREEPGRNLTHS